MWRLVKLLSLNGRPREVNINRYKIDWDGPCLSKMQRGVRDFLRPYWEHSKIVLEELVIPGSRMSLDLVSLSDKVAIEVQGAQHAAFNRHMHQNSLSKYRDQIKRDLKKGEWCERNGFKLIEVFETDLPLSPIWFWERYQVIL